MHHLCGLFVWRLAIYTAQEIIFQFVQIKMRTKITIFSKDSDDDYQWLPAATDLGLNSI